MKSYADLIVDGLDPDGIIKHRLYRQHCGVQNENGEDFVVKDLRLLGRDLTKTIIVDN